ncbi:MAG TPA: PAS domain S-box protein [Chitinophagaceae bacterium]|nr:PAS domain S-box protein [Chitinophagaceae bacterium]
MNRFYTCRNITIGVILSVALVSFFAWYSYINMNKAREETIRVNTTLKSLRTLENLMDDMQDIETSNRGYLISGNKDFLIPYYAAVKKLNADSMEVLRMHQVYPHRSDTLRQLISLVKRKIEIAGLAEKMVERNLNDSALQLVRSGRGKDIMDSIRQIVWAIETQDRRILEESNKSRQVAATTTAKLFIGAALGFIVIASLLFFRIKRELKQREVYESRIAYLAGLSEKANEAIVSIDASLNVISWNKGAELIYGYANEEVLGRNIAEITKSEALKDGDELILKEISLKGYAEFESKDCTKDGRNIYCLVSSTPLKDENGIITGFVSVIRDITQRKLAEKLLQEFNKELAEKVKEKTDDIKKSETKLRQVLDSAASEFYVIDREYKIILISKLAENNLAEAWGNKVSTGDMVINAIPKEKVEKIKSNYDRVFKGEKIEYEAQFSVQNGSRWVYVSYVPVKGDYDEITGAYVATKDITERKRVEKELQESEERYRTLIEQAIDCIVVTDQQGRFLQVNEAGIKLFNYSKEEFLKLSLADMFVIGPDDPPIRFEELRKGQGILSYRKVKKKDGTIFDMEINSKMLPNGNFIGIARDISERMNAQRILAESENRFRAIFNTQFQMVCLLDATTGVVLEVNKTALDITGYNEEEMRGKLFWDIKLWQHEEDRQLRIQRVKEAIQKASSGEFVRYEAAMGLPGREIEVVDFSIKPIPDADGNIKLLIIEGRLITEIKKAESELRESETKYRAFFENSLDGILLTSPDGSILSANPAACTMFGMTEDEIINAGRNGLVDLSDSRTEQLVEERRLKGKASGELAFIRKNGSKFPGEVSSAVFIDAYGSERTSMIIRDITDRKKAEEEIKKSNNRFEMISRTTNDAIWEWNIETGELWANETHQHLYGLLPGDPVPSEEVWRQKIHPEDRAVIVDRQEASLASGTNVFISEYRFLDARGEYIYLFDRCYIVRNKEGKPVRMTGSMMDITRRKEKERKLAEKEQQLRIFIENSPAALAMLDKDLKYIIASKRWLIDYRLGDIDLAGKSHYEVFPNLPQRWKDIHQRCLAGAIEKCDEDTFVREDGSIDWVRWEIHPWYKDTGETGGVFFLTEVITDRKEAAEELLRSQKQFQSLVENISGVYWVNDLDAEKVLYISPSYEAVWGRSTENYYKDPADFISSIHPDDKAALFDAYNTIKQTMGGKFFYRIIRPDGEIRWIVAKVNVIKGAENHHIEYGYAEDITEQKRAEEELVKSNERFNIVSKATSDIVWDWNLTQDTLWWNDNYYESLGYTKGSDIVPINEWYERIHPEEVERVKKKVNKVFASKSSVWRDEYRYRKADGNYLNFLDRGFIIRDENGKAIRMIGSMVDMTPIYTVQRKIAESEIRLRTIMDTDPECIKLMDEEARLLDINKAGIQMIESDRLDEVIGHSLLPLVAEKYKKKAAKLLKDAFAGKSGRLEFEMITLKNTHRWCEIHVVPFRNTEGLIVSALGVTRDITERRKAEEELIKSKETRELVMNSALDGIITVGKDQRILSWNPQAKGIFGWSENEVVGKKLAEVVIPERFRNIHNMGFSRYLETGDSPVLNRLLEVTGLHSSGREFNVELIIREIKSEEGDFLCTFVRDITERKKAELALRLSEEKYRTLIEQAADAIALYDAKGKILEANTSASKLLGYTKKELSVMNLTEILLEEEIKENPVQYDVLSAGHSTVKLRRMRRKDGSVVVTEVRSQQLPDGRFLSVVRDMTDRIKAEEELKASYKAVRKLTAHLQNIREEERTSIAREIHDELGQQLTVLKMDVSWLNKKFHGTDEKANQRLKELLSMIDETVKSVRRISSQLRPSLLDDLGLTAAMEWQLSEFEKRAGIKTKLITPEEEVDLSDAVKTALFRIFQESLTNVARHSRAKNVTVVLRKDDHTFILSITDDGKGFDINKVADKRTLGILGMKERSSMIGGTYEINSTPGGGTSVIISVPVKGF